MTPDDVRAYWQQMRAGWDVDDGSPWPKAITEINALIKLMKAKKDAS